MRFLVLTCALLLALAAPAFGQALDPPFTASDDPVVVDNPVQFTANLDPLLAPTVTRIDWDFGNGGSPIDASDTTPPFNDPVSVTYGFAGPRTVAMSVTTAPMTPPTVYRRDFTVVAPNAPPVAQFSYTPTNPIVGQEVLLRSFSYDPDGSGLTYEWSIDGSGFVADSDGLRAVTFSTPGPHQVQLRVADPQGGTSTTPVTTITVGPAPANPLPVAQFAVSPSEPIVGQQVSLKSFSYDPGGSVTSQRWDLDGDGDFDDNVSGATAFTTFTTPGTKTVRLEVRGSDGQTQTDTQTVRVQPRPVVRSSASLMYPFPVVRLAGSVLPNGARVRTLEVRAPKRSSIAVRCKGKSCPAKKIDKKQRKRSLRVKRMARFLRAGTVITVSVTKGNQIGKHTRWLIRGGKLPKRKDACLYPGRSKPSRCPRR